jgi:hypothetical protein
MPDSVAPSSAGSPTPQGLAPVVVPGDEAPDWMRILAELDARRGRALTEVDPALLPTYAQLGSTAWEQDAALLANLVRRGLRPQGLASRVLAVQTIDHAGPQAQLQVVDERAGYSMVDARGAVVQQVESAGPRRWTVTLVHLDPAATDPDPADPGESPGGADVLEGSVLPGHASGRDPGWRVAAVEPAEVGQSWDIEEGADGVRGTEGATTGDGP